MLTIEVRPGEGGRDAEAFADEVFDALLRLADVEYVEAEPTARGVRTFGARGPETLRQMAGTHRVQRIPKGSKARHTSTATVAVLDQSAPSGS